IATPNQREKVGEQLRRDMERELDSHLKSTYSIDFTPLLLKEKLVLNQAEEHAKKINGPGASYINDHRKDLLLFLENKKIDFGIAPPQEIVEKNFNWGEINQSKIIGSIPLGKERTIEPDYPKGMDSVTVLFFGLHGSRDKEMQ